MVPFGVEAPDGISFSDSGGVVPLSEAQTARVAFLVLDGARPDVLRSLLDRGELPNLARWVVEPGGFRVGTTVFPSTTGVAYIPLLLGRYPGPAGIPGIRWFDRAGADGGFGERWKAARSYCGVQRPWIDTDMTAGRSLFDIIPDSYAVFSPVARGLRRGGSLNTRAMMLLGGISHYNGAYLALDRAVGAAWLRAAGLQWRFLFVVYPGADGLTHHHDPEHPLVLEAYRQFDSTLGAFVAKVKRHGELPAFIVASDHGGSVMREHCDIAELLEARGIRTIRHPFHVWRGGARAAVMVSGNASVHVYFRRDAGPWSVLEGDDVTAGPARELLELPAVRLAAWRDGKGGVALAHGSDRAVLRADGDAIAYEASRGDPLNLGASSLRLEDRASLARSLSTGLPDGPRQLLQLFESPRTGDLVLAARLGSDFRGPYEIPEHRAGHGSLIAEHMEVPIAASVPLPDVPIRTVDLMPTVLELLGQSVPPGLDGVPASRLAAAAGAGAR
ncbi:MAG TPA: alkaline phosphatase family protein [Gemmatimonadales bacterium]|nr:alkaline phosphatase family protein [Gemmatimonadales bacterium]